VKPSKLSGELVGLALLAGAVIFNAVFVAPELRIGRVPLNDVVFHLAASERMESSFARGEPFLDPWVSEWALGYPVWRSYQPLPHVVGAAVLWLFRGAGEPAAIFAAFYYLLIVTFPISVYAGARLLGLSPPAAGLGALLVFASSAAGYPGSYGLGYGSILWRGSGLYTQLFALHLLAFAVGVGARALDGGRKTTRIVAGVLLALTGLAHIIFGYAAFVSVALLAVVGPRSRRSERLVRLLTIVVPAMLLLAWFVVPLALARGVVNRSRWEDPRKWDSYGAPFILRELLSGRLLDFGRAPLLSLLAALGALGAVLSRGDALARRLVALGGLWLALFFGRETWGRLMILSGIPEDFPMHRLQGVFELSAILVAAYGVVRLIQLVAERNRILAVAGAIAVAIAVLVMGADRSRFLKDNQAWGEGSLAAYEREQPDLEAALADVRSILAARPGRVSAGMAATWGGQFKVGSVPVYAFLTRDHIDQASFLYHSMSKTSDVMVVRDENNRGHDMVFGIRAVVAPTIHPMPQLPLRSVHGRFAVYESSPEGYFGVVDVVGHYTGPPSTNFDISSAWLKSALQPWGLVISLDPRSQVGPAIGRWAALPNPTPEQTTLRSRVLSETKTAENYRATIETNRASYAFLKITWNPALEATVDGQPAPVIHVTPGFCAVPIPAGQHEVSVAYRPGLLKPFLFVFGIGAFVLVWYFLARPRAAELEARASDRLAGAGSLFAKPAVAWAAALTIAALVALHPLFRGKLIAGHDATEYPPRVVEMARALGDGHVPPIWAPDLSAGHGQPLFEFSPPLPYWIALPFRAVGFGLTDSIQISLAFLFFLGAVAVYRIGLLLRAPPYAALGGAIAWLFGPYLCLDLFVRAAFAEAAGVAVAPIALWALLAAMTRPSAVRVAIGGLAVSLILLAHNAVALLLIPALSMVVLVYGVVVLRSNHADGTPSRLERFAPIAAGAAVIAAGLGLSAYFWIPSLADIPNLHEGMRLSDFNWKDHILWPFQLLWSRWGFGLSVPGPDDGLSFALGPAHLALGIAGVVVALRSKSRTRKTLTATFALCAVAGAFLTTYWASWFWSHSKLLQYIPLPWRALLLPGLFLSLLTIFALERLGPRWSAALLIVLVAINLPHTEPQGYLTYDDEYYSPESLATKGINTATHEAFEPRWTDVRPPYYAKPLVGLSGPIEVTSISNRTARRKYSVRASNSTTVESSVFFYPGWRVMIDDAPSTISPVPVRGTMQFDVPAGEHDVVIELRLTPVRRGSLLLSLGTVLLLAAAGSFSWRRRLATGVPRSADLGP
jgi:Bacterial membrane protein YfhO